MGSGHHSSHSTLHPLIPMKATTSLGHVQQDADCALGTVQLSFSLILSAALCPRSSGYSLLSILPVGGAFGQKGHLQLTCGLTANG